MFRSIFALILFLYGASSAFAQTAMDSELLGAAQKALPSNLSTNQIAGILNTGLWNSNHSALAVSVSRASKPSLVFVFLRQANGKYLAGNVSGVEDGNFGKLGIDRQGYDRFETTPTEWLPRTDGKYTVVMRTRAWKNGRRFTVSEKLLVAADGTPFYR